MRVVNYDSSRVTCLFPLEEVLPLAGISDREIIAAVAERYKFLRSPDLAKDDITKDGYKFGNGQFTFGNGIFRINDFSIYRDGLVINAATTDGSEIFLDDVIEFMQREFSFRGFETRPRRYFQSQIVAEFDRSPALLLKSANKLAAVISVPLAEIYEMEVHMQFARLDFDLDKKSSPASAIAVQRFIIERRAGVPFENERYFCAAPMRTNDHIKVLEEIEGLMD